MRATSSLIAASLLITVAGARPAAAQSPADSPRIEATSPGQQLPEDALEVKVIDREGDRSVLMVRNRTPFLVLIYVHGIRMGWLRPYATGVLRGLGTGYHNVYAHSRWGSAHWGPRPLWVPSRWTLFR